MVGETESKEACEIAIGRAVACSDVAHPSDGVFAFQIDVHHKGQVFFALVFAFGDIAPSVFLAINLHLVHHVGRQVFQGHTRISAKEVFAIDQQTAHILPIDGDLAVAQLKSREQLDEAVEHRAFGQLKRVGVVDEGVAFYHHANL